jgi:hypothetical protein
MRRVSGQSAKRWFSDRFRIDSRRSTLTVLRNESMT